MGPVIAMDDPSNYIGAIRRIRELWQNDMVEISAHAKRRMKDRGIDILDISYVILHGRIVAHERPSMDWQYTIEGKTIDGYLLRCVIAVPKELVVITVFELN
jgi:hypothetical protein